MVKKIIPAQDRLGAGTRQQSELRFAMIPLLRYARRADWYVRTFSNWPAVISSRLVARTPLEIIRLRDGPSFQLYDPQNWLDAYLDIFCQRLYSRSLEPIPIDGTVVDLGANVGLFSLFAATELVPAGRIVAVEADPECLVRLQANLQRNRIDARTIGAAVTAHSGTTEFWVDLNDSTSSTLFQPDWCPPEMLRKLAVQAISLEELVSRFGPVDFLKMDIEGGEHALVWDTSTATWTAVRAFCMEYHLGRGTGYRSDDDPELLLRQLKRLGFEITDYVAPSQRAACGYIAGRRGRTAQPHGEPVRSDSRHSVHA